MISIDQASYATERLAALKFFPSEPTARAEIAEMITRMVNYKHELEWLITAMIDRVGKWEGPLELRAIFCTRFKPADGIEANSSTPGFTAADSEMEYHRAIGATKRKEITSERGPGGLKKITGTVIE